LTVYPVIVFASDRNTHRAGAMTNGRLVSTLTLAAQRVRATVADRAAIRARPRASLLSRHLRNSSRAS
jgi:hypothetical protein